jgi:glutathione S-transferase
MMLYFNPASPFARKALVVAHERAQFVHLELVTAIPLPIRPVPELARVNPLGKVPTLVLEDGTALYDSRVIAEYLDSLGGGTRLFPASGMARWTALRRQAQADGIMDAAVAVRYERAVRPPERLFPEWVEGQLTKVRQALDALESEAASLSGAVTIGEVAIGCALGYLDFRYPEEAWRTRRPALAAFYEGFSARPSMRLTTPPAS